MTETPLSSEEWSIVELMGHVRITGKLSEVERFGSKLGKIDVIDKEGGTIATQYFGGSSVYRITPCTEDTAKQMARDASDIGPDTPWDLRQAVRDEYAGQYQEKLRVLEGQATSDEGVQNDDEPSI